LIDFIGLSLKWVVRPTLNDLLGARLPYVGIFLVEITIPVGNGALTLAVYMEIATEFRRWTFVLTALTARNT
jgi:hypothetical protein